MMNVVYYPLVYDSSGVIGIEKVVSERTATSSIRNAILRNSATGNWEPGVHKVPNTKLMPSSFLYMRFTILFEFWKSVNGIHT